jgi:hypothetical protein
MLMIDEEENREDLFLFLTAPNFIDGDQIRWAGIDQIQKTTPFS